MYQTIFVVLLLIVNTTVNSVPLNYRNQKQENIPHFEENKPYIQIKSSPIITDNQSPKNSQNQKTEITEIQKTNSNQETPLEISSEEDYQHNANFGGWIYDPATDHYVKYSSNPNENLPTRYNIRNFGQTAAHDHYKLHVQPFEKEQEKGKESLGKTDSTIKSDNQKVETDSTRSTKITRTSKGRIYQLAPPLEPKKKNNKSKNSKNFQRSKNSERLKNDNSDTTDKSSSKNQTLSTSSQTNSSSLTQNAHLISTDTQLATGLSEKINNNKQEDSNNSHKVNETENNMKRADVRDNLVMPSTQVKPNEDFYFQSENFEESLEDLTLLFELDYVNSVIVL